MNNIGSSAVLTDQAGLLSNSSVNTVTALAVAATLTGSLTITGIVDSAGVAAPWVLAPGTVAGQYAAPGAKHTGGQALQYALSSAADTGKAVVSWTTK